MPNNADQILFDREGRHEFIRPFVDRGFVVIALKANIPGPDKRLFAAYLIVGYFERLLDKIPHVEKYIKDGFDGPARYYVIKSDDPEQVKRDMMTLESHQPFGRLVDLDVHANSMKSLSRNTPRKCLICEQDAFVCGRNQTHPLSELLDMIQRMAYKDCEVIIRDLIDRSIMAELDLDPKFGLVTPKSNGSHPDMNYGMMVKAKMAIIPFLLSMFKAGWNEVSPSELFQEARRIGQEAERAMLQATKGVNAYKGLIFNLGLMVSSLGFVIKGYLPLKSIFDVIQSMTSPLKKEFLSDENTSGLNAYHEYGLMGARGEAMEGFPTVCKIIPVLKDLNRESLLSALVQAIRISDDTVLVKRAGSYAKMREIQSWFADLDVHDENALKLMTRRCVESNISFGGAADLLVCAVFYQLVSSTIAL
jgi:holo-ACP synthase / triphosphoribosyl-dephospho-CoA synthase